MGTDDQMQQIIALYADGLSTATIGAQFGVSDVTIGNWLRRAGVPRRHNGDTTKRLSEATRQVMIARYQAGEYATQLAKEFGVSQAGFSALLQRRKIPVHTYGNPGRYQCDHTFFQRIDSEAKAYWLGFLAADGTVMDRGHIVLILQSRDAEHVTRFRDALGATHPITAFDNHGYPAHKLYIASPAMAADLARYTVTPRKTHTIRWPELCEPWLRHYVRGYVEADGGFYAGMRTKPSTGALFRTWWFSISGNRQFLTALRAYFMERCGVRLTSLYHPKNNHPNIVRLNYQGGKQVRRMFDLLYDDATILLPRKYAAFFPLPTGLRVGIRNHNARFAEADILAIRTQAAAGVRHVDIARHYDVQQTTIWQIVTRRTWKHLP